MIVLGLLKSGKVRLRRTIDPDRTSWNAVEQICPHHGDALLDGNAHSVRYGEIIHDGSGKPDRTNYQEEADSETFVMGSDAAEFVNKLKDQVRKRQKRMPNVALQTQGRTFNNLVNVYGCERRILREELWRQQMDFREVHQQSLTEMEELRKFQSSTFDTLARRKLIKDQNTILELSGRVQELQNEVNCMNDSKDFQDAESVRSGNSHVTSRPVSFTPHPIPGGMLRHSFGMPSR